MFRGHHTSVAVLTGDESKEELNALGVDCLTYFGRGCRNVTHLLFPEGFDLNRFFEAIVNLSDVVNNKKYGNNYDYNKAVKEVFDLRPAAIIRDLNLLRPIYSKTAAYGHFGRELPDFTWEKTDRAASLKSLVK